MGVVEDTPLNPTGSPPGNAPSTGGSATPRRDAPTDHQSGPPSGDSTCTPKDSTVPLRGQDVTEVVGKDMPRNVSNSDALNTVQLAPDTATQPTIVLESLANTTFKKLILLTPIKIGLNPTISPGETSPAHSLSSVSHFKVHVGRELLAHSTQSKNYQPSPSNHIANSITGDLGSDFHLSTTPTFPAEEHPFQPQQQKAPKSIPLGGKSPGQSSNISQKG